MYNCFKLLCAHKLQNLTMDLCVTLFIDAQGLTIVTMCFFMCGKTMVHFHKCCEINDAIHNFINFNL